MKKLFTLIAAMMMLSASAASLTVFEGNVTSQDIPICSRFMDYAPYYHQVIYPAAQLTAMQGQDITSIKYYVANETGNTLSGGSVSLYIGTTDINDFSAYNVSFVPESGLTKVAQMPMTVGVQEIEFVFDNAWNYAGGNIVIETVIEDDGIVTGSSATNFLGVSANDASACGYWSVSSKDFAPKTTFSYGSDEPIEITSYTVVGPESIFGTNWNTEDTNNDMVLDEATGVYSWNKEGVTLYGNFDFKVVGNHSYSIYEWPVGPYNWTAVVDEEGVYTIAITFDPNAEEDLRIGCTLIKTGDITPVEHTYTVAGTPNLFGSFWDPSDAANNMVKGEDGIYTWTKNDVVFEEPAGVEFKVTQDHSWDYAWPSNNWYYEVTEAGTYDFVITFNAETKEITCTATKHDTPEPEYMRGDVNGDHSVSITDVSALIDYLLDDPTAAPKAADCNLDTQVTISDVSTLIDFLLYGAWPVEE